MGGPLDYFQAGQKIGKANSSPGVQASGNILDLFSAVAQKNMEVQATLGMQQALKDYEYKNDPQKQWFSGLTNPQNPLMGGASGGQPTGASVGNNGFVLDTVGPAGPTYKNFGAEKDQKRAEKMQAGAGAESGKIALAKESKKNIEDMKKILFPDGTPKSFNRAAATKSNVPLIGGAMPLDYEGQTLQRKGGASLAARQLIQTGVAARPEETKALYRQFMSGAGSDAQAAFDGLNELQRFYDEYLATTDPSGMFHQSGPGSVDPARRAEYAAALGKYPGKKTAILAKYKNETGVDYE